MFPPAFVALGLVWNVRRHKTGPERAMRRGGAGLLPPAFRQAGAKRDRLLF